MPIAEDFLVQLLLAPGNVANHETCCIYCSLSGSDSALEDDPQEGNDRTFVGTDTDPEVLKGKLISPLQARPTLKFVLPKWRR